MTVPSITGQTGDTGPMRIDVQDTDAGNVLITFTSDNHRLIEHRELTPADARAVIAQIQRVLQGIGRAKAKHAADNSAQ